MNISKSLHQIVFILLALAGVLIFFINNFLENTQTLISHGTQAQKAIQLLDEMRRPILAIESALHLEGDHDKKDAVLKQQIDRAKITLNKYLDATNYNPQLRTLVEQLEDAFKIWIKLKNKIWHYQISLNDPALLDQKPSGISVKNLNILSQQENKQFFVILDILALGEDPLHDDIDNGDQAESIYKISGAILITYLFILIIIFQRIRHTEMAHLKKSLEQQVELRTDELGNINKELEAFSYSVSHDLRAPLRSINGFSQALLEDYNDSLDDTGKDYLNRVSSASVKMSVLIDDLLELSRISRNEINKQDVDLSVLADQVVTDLRASSPERQVKVSIQNNLHTIADKHLMEIVLTNLLSNAWKYSSNEKEAQIEFGLQKDNSGDVFFVKDNGAGFDMQYASKLFSAFQRLHGNEFKGNGIGLATVKRILNRHKGSIWAESKLNEGACFYFKV